MKKKVQCLGQYDSVKCLMTDLSSKGSGATGRLWVFNEDCC